MDTESTPVILSLRSCQDPRAGGKAVHLAKLADAGLRVPDGFVLIGAASESLPAEIDAAYARLGGPVAVRSSALSEDSVDTSFAGQYDTFLGIDGADAVKDAITKCLRSARAARADAYREAVNAQQDAAMSVVVQRMVDARAAGVLFTRNPVNGVEDEIVIEATRGLGDALVSGHVAAHRMIVSRAGKVISNDTQNVEASLDADLAAKLVRDALEAEKHFGHALDMEWALDPRGEIHWLQARPITTTNLPDIDELDSVLDWSTKRILTTYNVSEILPGAATPLGSNIALDCLNKTMRELYGYFGIPENQLAQEPLTVQFSGHLFLHLNPMYLSSLYLLGSTKEGLDLAIAGHPLEAIELGPPAPAIWRAYNAIGYFRYLFKAREALEALLVRTAHFKLALHDDPRVVYRNIEAAIPNIDHAMGVHLHTSALSGALQNILLPLISGGGSPTAEHQAIFSGLLAFVDPTDHDAHTSSLGLATAIDRLVGIIAANASDNEKMVKSSPEEALVWLRSEQCTPAVREAFEEFLQHHGHRCVRELEIRQADWGEDPRPLISNIQAVLATRTGGLPSRKRDATPLPDMPAPKRWFAEKIVKSSREALVLRERSKSHAVRLLRALRPGYLRIAEKLVDAKILPDADVIFFFTRAEVGRMLDQPDPSLVRRALHRRRLLAQQMSLEFPRVSVGKPNPIQQTSEDVEAVDVMNGTPVSRGVVVGLARVARSPEEAKAIEPGEILVVPYTDVGWAPYFLRAAGLASEIGGTLSHGAVVARECGLPAIVNLPRATRRFRTGDKLRLDGNTGELRLLARAETH
jgi:rifampicin phosphotransferase